MDDSLAVVRRHREAGTLLDADRQDRRRVLDELAAAGYWGLLSTRNTAAAALRSQPSRRS